MRRRRTRRCSAVAALASRGATVLQAWLWLIVFIFQHEFRISDSIKPGYLDFDNLPDTNFSCAGKVIGGYYADLETSCQMFHVCTVGQGDEPMDIKFLCLNGTVFDQETRVCERVDEVDCTKSEQFYSLNLELYGSTQAPAIEPEFESDGSSDQLDDKSDDKKQTRDPPATSAQPDPTPQPERKKEEHTEHVEPVEDNMEPEEEHREGEEEDYDDYTLSPVPPTTTPPPTTTTTTTTTTTPPPTSSRLPTYRIPPHPTQPHDFAFHLPVQPSASPQAAISVQRQSYPQNVQPPRLTLTSHRSASTAQPRPADHVYITASPQTHSFSEIEQIGHYELYESSKNNPRRPAPFQHPPRIPQGFHSNIATSSPPHSQVPSPGQYDRPIQSYQPSEKHEILYDDRFRPSPSQPTFDYSRFHLERKRSHETEPSEARQPPLARSVSSTPASVVSSTSSSYVRSERPVKKSFLKSPPRVIVTASASVSDSNGKKLNYTVGNVVSAVKPIVPINYDDYKESDIIYDPFFLDVPKLKKRLKITGKRSAAVIVLPKPAIPLAEPPKRATTTRSWLPPDYVDDNYEPDTFSDAPLPEPDVKDPLEKKSIVKETAPKVISSQTVEKKSPAKSSLERRQNLKSSFNMERLLASLPSPGGGAFELVRVMRPGIQFSCDARPHYRALVDSRDCRTFHVCAGPSIHVMLKCLPELYFNEKIGTCTTPQKDEQPCNKLLENV